MVAAARQPRPDQRYARERANDRTGAERSRRKRARRRDGLALYQVTVDRAACEEALQRARNFTEAQLDDAKLVEAELSEVLGLWFERWLRLGHE
jgi:hypothetical protein